MKLTTKKGEKVKFCLDSVLVLMDDLEYAMRYLDENDVYIVKKMIIHDWKASVCLEEFPTLLFDASLFQNEV